MLVISWAAQHGRSASLAAELGGRDVYLMKGILNRRTAVFRYLRATYLSHREIRKTRPGAVILMLPPFPALVVLLCLARIYGFELYLDCHSGVFNDPKWEWARRPTLALAKLSCGVIVTNRELEAEIRERGFQVLVIDDPPLRSLPARPRDSEFGTVLFPCSYSSDEPVDQVQDAARKSPSLRFILTGDAPPGVVKQAPRNVFFTGWLTAEQYSESLINAQVVLALTIRPLTMQRAGYEAMAYGKALVTAESTVLQSYFQDAAVYVNPMSGESIREGILKAVRNAQHYEREILRLYEKKCEIFERQIDPLRRRLAQSTRV